MSPCGRTWIGLMLSGLVHFCTEYVLLTGTSCLDVLVLTVLPA